LIVPLDCFICEVRMDGKKDSYFTKDSFNKNEEYICLRTTIKLSLIFSFERKANLKVRKRYTLLKLLTLSYHILFCYHYAQWYILYSCIM